MSSADGTPSAASVPATRNPTVNAWALAPTRASAVMSLALKPAVSANAPAVIASVSETGPPSRSAAAAISSCIATRRTAAATRSSGMLFAPPSMAFCINGSLGKPRAAPAVASCSTSAATLGETRPASRWAMPCCWPSSASGKASSVSITVSTRCCDAQSHRRRPARPDPAPSAHRPQRTRTGAARPATSASRSTRRLTRCAPTVWHGRPTD